MTDPSRLIAAAQNGDIAALRNALSGGADLVARDAYGWSALDWAAGRGDLGVVSVLVDAGADPRASGPEGRSPYEIAAAAGRMEVARFLRELTGEGAQGFRPYCKAYLLRDLRAFSGWSGGDGLSDDAVLYLHDDYTVTRSIWRDEDVEFVAGDGEWVEFCHEALGFRVPDELELVSSDAVPHAGSE